MRVSHLRDKSSCLEGNLLLRKLQTCFPGHKAAPESVNFAASIDQWLSTFKKYPKPLLRANHPIGLWVE